MDAQQDHDSQDEKAIHVGFRPYSRETADQGTDVNGLLEKAYRSFSDGTSLFNYFSGCCNYEKQAF